MTVSGYLSIYNDWDLLEPALYSVLPVIDELVVVDGGYRWMAAFQTGIGRDPAKSAPQVHDILRRLPIPIRYISGVWPNEIEKRLAGYRACTGRYVLRLDADEILFWDQDALTRFFATGAAAADMEMPAYVAPGWIEGGAAGLPRQACLFDRQQISAEDHLHYLWLVLTADTLPAANARLPVFEDAIAFNAHLTNWRTPQTAIQRACFYVLNWYRQHGVPSIPALRSTPLESVAELLEYVSARQFFETMLGNALVAGHFDLGGRGLRETPLTRDQEAPLLPLYQNYHTAQTALNRKLRQSPRYFSRDQAICIDITTEASFTEIIRAGEAVFEISAPISAVKSTLHRIVIDDTVAHSERLDCKFDGKITRVTVPYNARPELNVIKRVLEIQIWPEADFGSDTIVCR